MSAFYKNLSLFLLFLVVVVLLISMFNTAKQATVEITFSKFLDELDTGEVHEVTIQGSEIKGTYASGKTFKVNLPPEYPDLVKELRTKNVKIKAEPVKDSFWTSFLFMCPGSYITSNCCIPRNNKQSLCRNRRKITKQAQ